MARPGATQQGLADDTERATAIRFLGGVLGLLEGPKPALPAADAVALVKELTAVLGDNDAGELEMARQEVTERFAQFRQEAAALKAEADVKQNRLTEKERKKLNAAQAEAEKEDAVLQTKSDSLKKDQLELAAIEQQLRELRERRQMLDDQAAVIQAQADLANVANQGLATRNGGLGIQGRLQAQATTGSFNAALMQLGTQARLLDQQVLVLSGRQAALLVRDDVEGAKLARQAAIRTSQGKQIRAMQKKVDHAKTSGHQAEWLSDEVTNLENYLPSPLDAAEQRMRRATQK